MDGYVRLAGVMHMIAHAREFSPWSTSVSVETVEAAIQIGTYLVAHAEAAFYAEYQNEPLLEEIGDGEPITPQQVAEKVNRFGRGEVPVGCEHLTMFIDVQANLLFYVVAAWEEDFTGYVIDYGAYPDQKRPYCTLRDARRILSLATPGAGLEAAIYSGLDRLTGEYVTRQWQRDDGSAMRIERCLVDANRGQPLARRPGRHRGGRLDARRRPGRHGTPPGRPLKRKRRTLAELAEMAQRRRG